jgi:hypothetical protein
MIDALSGMKTTVIHDNGHSSVAAVFSRFFEVFYSLTRDSLSKAQGGVL